MGFRRKAAHQIYRHAGGFSLISMVIGLGIGLLAIELALHCLSMSHKQWVLTQKSLSFNRNHRSIFLSLRRDLNLAGYRGLRDTDRHYPVAESRVLSASTLKKRKENGHSSLLPGSDILVIQNVPVGHWRVEKQGPDFLWLEKYSHNGLGLGHIKTERPALIADAQGAAWLSIKTVKKRQQSVELNEKIARHYGKNAVFTPVEQLCYFVASSARHANNRYTLWRQSGQNTEALVEGITAFNVQYKLLESGICNQDQYWSTDSVPERSLICGVRVSWADENHTQTHSIDISVDQGAL